MANTRLHKDKHGFKTWTPHFWRFEGANPARFGTDLAHFLCAGRGLTVIVSVVVLLRGGLDHRHGDGGGADRDATRTRLSQTNVRKVLEQHTDGVKARRRQGMISRRCVSSIFGCSNPVSHSSASLLLQSIICTNNNR